MSCTPRPETSGTPNWFGRLRGAHARLQVAEVHARVLHLVHRGLEHLARRASALTAGADVPWVSSALDDERGRLGGDPVEVVVAHVHEPGARPERQPGARLLLTADADLERVAGTEPERRRRHLGGDLGAAALHRAALDLEDELLARAHASRHAVGAGTVDRGAARHLVDVGSTPRVRGVGAAEERRALGIAVAGGVREPARDLGGEVAHALDATLLVVGPAVAQDLLAHRREAFAHLAPALRPT